MRAALKTFYYQRCSTPKLPAHAGTWADNQACHLTDSAARPAAGHTDYGTLDLRGGHHDAGDYRQYRVEGGVVGHALPVACVQDNPGVFRDGDGNIPESSNGVADLLDEVKWELDWLLKMQLPTGAVPVPVAGPRVRLELAAQRGHRRPLLPESEHGIRRRAGRHTGVCLPGV